MPHLQLKFDATACADPVAAITTEFPDEVFKVLAGHLTDRGIVGLVEIETPNAAAIIQHFDDASEIHSHDVVYADEETALLRFVIADTQSFRALRTSGIPPNFPSRIQDGWLYTKQTASHEQLSQYIDEMEAADLPYQIQSVDQSHDQIELLTERQQEFITEAIERGYYDSPRDCTLTELAEMLDVNTSAASGILHRAEGRIIKEFVAKTAPEVGEV